MRHLGEIAANIALNLPRKMSDAELREIADERTERDLDDYELDWLVRRLKGYPAYEALPEEPEDSPQEQEPPLP